MIDIKWIRENADEFDRIIKMRNCEISANDILKIDQERRDLLVEIENLQAQRNNLARQIAQVKSSGESANDLMSKSKEINIRLGKINSDEADRKLNDLLLMIPNLPENEVPPGKDENDNIEIERYGKPRKFDFEIKSHDEVGEKLGQLDFKQSSLISGARFSTLSGDLALLERALSNFMIDHAIKNDYLEASVPNLVKSSAMENSGQLPKFYDEAFRTIDDYWLIPTAEVPLVNLVAKQNIDIAELPIRFCAYTPCFRSEAGSAGKDTKGMIRQHQFKKVELVSITSAEDSKEEHERMTNTACEVLKLLELPFRKILLCSGDMGFCAQKTYDIEVWLPSQNKYREISSCSNCGDFQARRAKIKYKSANSSGFAHTLNGSSLAVGRTIVAILENYQNQDGSVTVPKVLVDYMNGKKVIR